MPRVGVVGALVWDEIHGREARAAPVTEWGGIAYALAGFDAALDPDWELVPLVKVGRDLATPAERFVRSLTRVAPSSRLALVDAANNRVVLRYETSERRCERMSGGVPPWTWDELGPMVRDLDALYINFISGFELCLGTATALRQAFDGPIYADLHSLMLGMGRDGLRALRPLPDAPNWYRCFNFIQMNEAEMHQLSPDPLQLAGHMLDVGVSALLVTMGPRGAVYVAGGGADSAVVRSALVKAPVVETLDPTGCGDVFGATVFARLVAGVPLENAISAAVGAAARNASFRGASGLASHLRGTLVTP